MGAVTNFVAIRTQTACFICAVTCYAQKIDGLVLCLRHFYGLDKHHASDKTSWTDLELQGNSVCIV